MGSLSPLIDFGRRAMPSSWSHHGDWMPVDLEGVSISAISLADGDQDSRIGWLRSVLPEADALPLAANEAGFSPAMFAAGDVVILHGSDFEALLAATDRCRNLADSRVLIVLAEQYSSIRAAALLNAGADDVLGFGQSADEVRARISSSVRRHRIMLENRLSAR